TGEPQSIELGDAAEIDHLVHDWRKTLANGRNPSVAALARKLDEKIMQPVRKLLGEARSVLISPDGALNLIPFAALKDEHDRYLVERVALTYLSSGRDLLRLDSKIDSQQPATLLADVDFGKVDNKTTSTPSDRGATHRRAGDYQGEFQPLPGTKAEAQAISKILPAATILTGQQASESKLKQLDRPNILHIATHGFFLSDLPENIAKTRGVPLMGFSQIDLPRKNNPLFNENPLLRSGLALANANRLESGEDDGVLTAMEAANLDLWGTQLVVLSACETGVGEVQNGQGVFGLRRALVIAGSETQVMSLWKVDDDGTKELMVDYYQRLLNSEGRSEAMRQTQLAMLASDNRNHPFYWASFIVSGDWKPMERSK
ncbi:MAG: CHAT domain-containing protein, partial [Nitrosomonas sp.]|uniref:CHAT domain-containing protein n=1 Tax=Nitrosomonas sp. TaxID=42353 RepID=UPI0032EB194B